MLRADPRVAAAASAAEAKLTIHDAVKMGFEPAVRRLLAAGAPINSTDEVCVLRCGAIACAGVRRERGIVQGTNADVV